MERIGEAAMVRHRVVCGAVLRSKERARYRFISRSPTARANSRDVDSVPAAVQCRAISGKDG